MRLLIFLLLAADVLPAACMVAGTVTQVHDGDTFHLRVSSRVGSCRDMRDVVSIRIAHIDAPELRQEFGAEAGDQLGHLIAGREVAVSVTGASYGRVVGDVQWGYTDVGAAMIDAGAAWLYRPPALVRRWRIRTPRRDRELAAREAAAKRARRGLWGMPKPVPPWRFRHPAAQ